MSKIPQSLENCSEKVVHELDRLLETAAEELYVVKNELTEANNRIIELEQYIEALEANQKES